MNTHMPTPPCLLWYMNHPRPGQSFAGHLLLSSTQKPFILQWVLPPLSCFTSFPSTWSILSADHQTVACSFLKQTTNACFHFMVHASCCLYPVYSKVPWKCCSSSAFTSLLPIPSLNLFQSNFVPTVDPEPLLPWSPVMCVWSAVSSQRALHLTPLLFPPSFWRHCLPQASCFFTAFGTSFAQLSSYLTGCSVPLAGCASSSQHEVSQATRDGSVLRLLLSLL